MRVVFRDEPSAAAASGLSGSADIPEPPVPHADGGRIKRLQRALAGTITALPRVLRLGWQASPALTLGLAASTVVSGLIPAAMAYLSRLLLNAVLHGYLIHSRHLADQSRVRLPFLDDLRLTSVQAVVVLALAQLALLAVSMLASTMRSLTQQLLQERAALVVQAQIMDHARTLDLEFFEDSKSYDLLRHAQREASTRPVTMIASSFGLLQSAVTFLSVIGLLAGLNPWLAVLALLAPVPAFIADSRHGHRAFILARWASPIHRRMEYLASLVTTDTFAKEVRVLGLGRYFTDRYRQLGAVYYDRQRTAVRRRQLATAGWSSAATAAQTLSYLYVAVQAIRGVLTVGDLVMFTAASTALQGAVQGVFQACTGMYENNLYLLEYFALLAVPSAIERSAVTRTLPAHVVPHVVFDHVSFSYPGATRKALDDVSFDIRPGQTVAVVGRNGAGKSTLLKLLCRLYDPTEGRILLDGIDLREVSPAELRSRIAILFQDYVTYQASAAENIGLGDLPHLDDRPRIADAADRAGVSEVITRLPRSYDTPLGKWFGKGVELSGGEWQKVALARTLMRDTPLLALDEPTSALDAQAEHDLFARLGYHAEQRTTLYISHRFSTVRRADRIILLADGRIAEAGTHTELMELDGVYATLFKLQASAYTDA